MVMQVVCTMFITNNNASFHLCSKENLVKHQKVSKYYEHDYLRKSHLLFMSLLTDGIVKNSYNFVKIYLILPKKHHRLNLKGFQY